MLATLYNVFTDKRGQEQFSFANNDEHMKIWQGILLAHGVLLPQYVLDPLPADTSTWLAVHQNIHTLMDAVLGIAGNDLSDVDFSKPSEAAAWIWLHAQEHYQAAEKLGLT